MLFCRLHKYTIATLFQETCSLFTPLTNQGKVEKSQEICGRKSLLSECVYSWNLELNVSTDVKKDSTI